MTLPAFFDEGLRFMQGVEGFAIEPFVSEPAIEAFTVSVPRKDCQARSCGLCANGCGPVSHGPGNKPGTIVGSFEGRNARRMNKSVTLAPPARQGRRFVFRRPPRRQKNTTATSVKKLNVFTGQTGPGDRQDKSPPQDQSGHPIFISQWQIRAASFGTIGCGTCQS